MSVWTSSGCPPLGRTVFVVGVEHRPNGAVRIFVGSRGEGQYVLLDPEGTEAVERAWNSHHHVCIEPAALEGLPIFNEAHDLDRG